MAWVASLRSWDTLAQLWVEEESNSAELGHADAAARVRVSNESFPNESVFALLWDADALVVVERPGLTCWAAHWVSSAFATGRMPEFAFGASLHNALALASLKVEEVSVVGIGSVQGGAILDVAVASTVVLTPVFSSRACLGKADASTLGSVEELTLAADLGSADALTLGSIPDVTCVSTFLWSTFAIAVFEIEVLRVSVNVWAFTVEANASTVLIAEVEVSFTSTIRRSALA